MNSEIEEFDNSDLNVEGYSTERNVNENKINEADSTCKQIFKTIDVDEFKKMKNNNDSTKQFTNKTAVVGSTNTLVGSNKILSSFDKVNQG